MLGRLETLVLMGMDIPILAIRQQIASALDIIVHVGRLRDKSRKVLEIVEVGSVVDNRVELFSLFSFQEKGEVDGKVVGRLEATGHQLHATQKCKKAGVKI